MHRTLVPITRPEVPLPHVLGVSALSARELRARHLQLTRSIDTSVMPTVTSCPWPHRHDRDLCVHTNPGTGEGARWRYRDAILFSEDWRRDPHRCWRGQGLPRRHGMGRRARRAKGSSNLSLTCLDFHLLHHQLADFSRDRQQNGDRLRRRNPSGTANRHSRAFLKGPPDSLAGAPAPRP